MTATMYEGPDTYEEVSVRKITRSTIARQIPVECNGVFRTYPLGDDGVLHLPEAVLLTLLATWGHNLPPARVDCLTAECEPHEWVDTERDVWSFRDGEWHFYSSFEGKWLPGGGFLTTCGPYRRVLS
ncbi:hypothetical protein PBI_MALAGASYROSE_67 [Mycobacterium phage MalagasyRose]|uniref:Uncharacterized protein n=1 Tax=Mycobacterium phage MalagasyRose TaxID=2599870 RepID=A0A5J6TE87_9CAUD|nr:hypothetical protein QEH39_gp21 [Mycobacterium phage MalagasyRose]QFG08915.1 hypothetical protein PBI_MALAGASYROSE_67 [Mycobacterium phage MalagasyRose]